MWLVPAEITSAMMMVSRGEPKGLREFVTGGNRRQSAACLTNTAPSG